MTFNENNPGKNAIKMEYAPLSQATACSMHCCLFAFIAVNVSLCALCRPCVCVCLIYILWTHYDYYYIAFLVHLPGTKKDERKTIGLLSLNSSAVAHAVCRATSSVFPLFFSLFFYFCYSPSLSPSLSHSYAEQRSAGKRSWSNNTHCCCVLEFLCVVDRKISIWELYLLTVCRGRLLVRLDVLREWDWWTEIMCKFDFISFYWMKNEK